MIKFNSGIALTTLRRLNLRLRLSLFYLSRVLQLIPSTRFIILSLINLFQRGCFFFFFNLFKRENGSIFFVKCMMFSSACSLIPKIAKINVLRTKKKSNQKRYLIIGIVVNKLTLVLLFKLNQINPYLYIFQPFTIT